MEVFTTRSKMGYNVAIVGTGRVRSPDGVLALTRTAWLDPEERWRGGAGIEIAQADNTRRRHGGDRVIEDGTK